jgi:hypothetical protein
LSRAEIKERDEQKAREAALLKKVNTLFASFEHALYLTEWPCIRARRRKKRVKNVYNNSVLREQHPQHHLHLRQLQHLHQLLPLLLQ